MSTRIRTVSAVLAVIGALVVVLAGQSLADAAAPQTPNAALTGQAVGRAGFAYLTGLRVFVAELLWNRLDPQSDTYYRKRWGLAHDTFILPSVKVITMLDPQFVEAYYVAPDVLILNSQLPGTSPQEARSRFQAGVALAKEGVINNPKSGVLLASYAQILWTDTKDLKAAVPFATRAMATDIVWRTDEEEWDSMAILKGIFTKAGMPSQAAAAQAVKTAIDNNPNATKDKQGS